jgi:hypothetical protein
MAKRSGSRDLADQPDQVRRLMTRKTAQQCCSVA